MGLGEIGRESSMNSGPREGMKPHAGHRWPNRSPQISIDHPDSLISNHQWCYSDNWEKWKLAPCGRSLTSESQSILLFRESLKEAQTLRLCFFWQKQYSSETASDQQNCGYHQQHITCTIRIPWIIYLYINIYYKCHDISLEFNIIDRIT